MQIDDIQLSDGTRLHLASSPVLSADALLETVLPAHRVSKREGGKPDLVREDGRLVPCSITHTTGFTAVCWGHTGQLGIDAERSDRNVHPGLAARMRHPDDDSRLEDNPIEAWIVKESVLKCIGTGLRLGMNQISVRFMDSDHFIAVWNGHAFHGILLTRHPIRLSIVHTTSPI